MSIDIAGTLSIIGIIATFLVSIINISISVKSLRYSKYYDNIIPIKIKNFELLQNSLVEIIRMTYNYKYIENNNDLLFNISKVIRAS